MSANPKEEVSYIREYRVLNDIKKYFKELNQNGKESTISSYEGTIKEFFEIVFKDKDIKLIEVNDIINLEKSDIVEYRDMLKKKGNTNNTINKKVTSVKSLFNRGFAGIKAYREMDTEIFNIKRLSDDAESYDSLTKEEAERLAEMVLTTEKHNSLMKRLLILTSIRTSYRFGELTKLTWDDFHVKENYVLVRVRKEIEKKNKEKFMPITIKLYEEILQLKDYEVKGWKHNDNIVFKLTKDSVKSMMDRLNKKARFLGDRHIVFHSFRGVAADWDYEQNKDIKRVTQQLNHSNMNTSFNHYMNKDKDFSTMAGIKMEEEIDMSFLEDLSVEDFKNFIKISSDKIKSDLKKFYENEVKLK